MPSSEIPSGIEIVMSCDAERRGLERALHDGAQQRLAAIAATLALARRRAAAGEAGADELLEEVCAETQRSLEDLRDLARRIYPTVVAERGLGPALHDLARRAPIPATVTDEPSERLPEPLEITAYLVALEALADLATHAGATEARIGAFVQRGHLVIEVAGDGFAEPSRLPTVPDRVRALGGELAASGDSVEGTTVRASLPITS